MAISYKCDICGDGFESIYGIINGQGTMMLELAKDSMLEIKIKTIKCREVCFRCMGVAFIASKGERDVKTDK